MIEEHFMLVLLSGVHDVDRIKERHIEKTKAELIPHTRLGSSGRFLGDGSGRRRITGGWDRAGGY